ncbi:MAG: DNA-binding protein [Thermoplasmata archaeon]|nr:MAG: DNA-binding protein [Thermoplasmata archaeon]
MHISRPPSISIGNHLRALPMEFASSLCGSTCITLPFDVQRYCYKIRVAFYSMVYVLDTSAILSGKFFGSDTATSPKVLKEIRPKGHSWRLLESMKSIGMKVVEPPPESIKLVEQEAEKTGDRAELTDTDIEVIALAHYLDAILLTDDYAMQNVATSLQVKYESILEEGIKEHVHWIYRCSSCGKRYRSHQTSCPVCGGTLKRIRKEK